MTSYHRPSWVTGKGACQIAMSDDLVNWSQPILIAPENKGISKPYFTLCNNNESGVHDITGKEFLLLFETNGEDVHKTVITIETVKDKSE